MTPLEWAAISLALFLAGGFVVAVFFYLRTAYRKGGWPEVKSGALIAMFALVVFYILRVAENSELGVFKEAVRRMIR